MSLIQNRTHAGLPRGRSAYAFLSVGLGWLIWSVDTSIEQSKLEVKDRENVKASIELYFDEKEEIVPKISKRNAGPGISRKAGSGPAPPPPERER